MHYGTSECCIVGDLWRFVAGRVIDGMRSWMASEIEGFRVENDSMRRDLCPIDRSHFWTGLCWKRADQRVRTVPNRIREDPGQRLLKSWNDGIWPADRTGKYRSRNGLHWNPACSVDFWSDPLQFASKSCGKESGPDYMGKYPFVGFKRIRNASGRVRPSGLVFGKWRGPTRGSHRKISDLKRIASESDVFR